MQDAVDARKYIEVVICRKYWTLPIDDILSRFHSDTVGQAT
jgi:hypothetical protein